MDRGLIEQFMEVTGKSEAVAAQYLTLAEGNVEQAISLMFEGGGGGGGGGGGSNESNEAAVSEEPEVRPPIPPVQEILFPHGPVCHLPVPSPGVFDRFRDFSVEIQRQEEEMSRRYNRNESSSKGKTKRLEDLFRPPYDILYLGSFIEAREHAKQRNRWLLVNIQNPQEFSCQILNRDVWPNKQIQEIIKDHFVLWQVLSNSSDGKKYIDFYNVIQYPYLSVVDPRTGECINSYNNITIDNLLTGLNDILSNNPSPDCSSDTVNHDDHSEPSSSKVLNTHFDLISQESSKRMRKSRASIDAVAVDEPPAMGINMGSTVSIRGKRSRIELAEEIYTPGPSNKKEITPTEKESANENKCKAETTSSSKPETSNKTEIPNGEPSLKLCLRLPSGGREAVSMCAKDTIQNFIEKIEEMGYSRQDHSFLTQFPKTDICSLPSNTQLLDSILYPSNTVFISKV